MSHRDHVEAVLGHYVQAMGLPPIPLDDSDAVRLEFDGMPVSFTYGAEPAELLWIHAELGEIDGEDPRALGYLMTAGLGLWAANQLTLGLADDGTTVWGYSVIPAATLEPALLGEVMANLLECELALRHRIAAADFDLGDALERAVSDEEAGGAPDPGQRV